MLDPLKSVSLLSSYLRVFLFAFFVLMLSAGTDAAEKKHVLVIHSYHPGLPWTDGQDKGIKELVKENHTLEIYTEYLDTKRWLPEEVEPSLVAHLKIKYSKNPPQLIIVTDNNALDFTRRHYKELFNGVPVVFCGINNYTSAMLKGFDDRITGVVQRLDPAGTVRIIRKIQPRTKRVFVISGSTPTGQAIREEAERDLAVFKDMKFVWWNKLSTEELISNLKGLASYDAVLICNFNRDSKGIYYSHEEAAKLISDNTPAVVYAMEDTLLETGVVGGSMNSSLAQGRTAGTLAMKIIKGGKIPPVIEACPNEPMFDYNVLLKHGLADAELPSGSIVINKPVDFYSKYKKVIWTTASMFFILLLAFITVSHALLRSKRMERLLNRKEENLRITLHSIGDGVISTDINGCVTLMNPVAEALTGWTGDDAHGKELSEVFNILDAQSRLLVHNPVEKVLTSGESSALRENTVLISKNTSQEYHIADSAAPIKDNEGKLYGVIMVFRDVTEEYRLQAQLNHTRKMEAIGRLAGGVAHDFNNMLTGIMSCAQLMLSPRVDLNECGKKYVDMILKASERAADLTSKLLAFGRKGKILSTAVNINEVLEDTVQLLSRTIDKKIEITINKNAENYKVIGDNSNLQNAFMNIGINASHAMPDGGKFSIETFNLNLDEFYCETSPFELIPGEYIELEFEDSGCGIPPENVKMIFEPFYTTKEQGEGTGLGLAAVYGTVLEHHGAISVYSEVGVGTSFHILLPCSEENVHFTKRSLAPLKGTGTILLVEDEEIIMISGQHILEEMGYKVMTAKNGLEAVEVFASSHDKIDLVLMDMIMPEMNGREAFFKMKEIDEDCKIVMSSGFANHDAVKELKEAGLLGFVKKPYRDYDLAKTINEILGGE